VCLTPAPPGPPVPIPYPNIAMHAMAAPFAPNVLLSMMPAINQGSMIPMTMGMEPGLANPLYKQMGMFTMGDPVVLVNFLPGIALTHPTSGNMMNNAIGAVQVPSVTNVLFSLLDVQELRDLSEAVGVDGSEEDAAVGDARMVTGGVGYVAVRRISTAAPSAFHHAVSGLLSAGLDALIIDLRGNRGGDAMAALSLAGDFVSAGETLAVSVDGDDDATVHRSRCASPYRFPVAVLVDGRTASAAELLAGSLQARRRALVAGETTWGKCVASAVTPTVGSRSGLEAVARFVFPPLPVRPDLGWDDLG
jgi:carboxyl-terminal processing protease